MKNIEALKHYILKRLELELDDSLTYHSVRHTRDVMASTERLAMAEKVNETDAAILEVGALLHDSGFLLSMDDHEEHGCILAREILPNYGFKVDEIEAICKLIMATKLPQIPGNILEKIICDADLDYLGRKDFFVLGEGLFHEFMARGIVKDFCNWDEIQISFLSQHKYFTESSISLREPVKMQHLEQVKARYQHCL